MNNTILIIDDDPLNIKVISAYIIDNEYEIIKATDGHSGIKMASELKPDLILLDVLMPDLDGFETCLILKDKEETKHIPIIFLTALTDSESIGKAFKLGAVDYVTKPIEFNSLLARIKTHLHLSKMTENLEIEVNNKTIELLSANESLKVLVKDRELLIKELHHRTKNNMHVISSMLALHSTYSENTDLSLILKEIGNKIESMALIHQKLYQSSDFTNIDMQEYINDLVNLIHASYNYQYGKIKLKFDLDKIYVPIDIAISCGLIINELLSNSFKYAFADKPEGFIEVNLKLINNNRVLLKIGDNGTGFKIPDDLSSAKTLGMKIVIGVAQNQLQGEIVFKSEEGFSCEIIFPKDI